MTMEPVVSHLHTHFLFAFSMDRQLVLHRHRDAWNGRSWIDGIEHWIRKHDSHAPAGLGRWQRSPYRDFSLDSPAYQDMVFFHPFVRRIYFDAVGMRGGKWEGEEIGGETESLLRFYRLPMNGDRRVTLYAEDTRGRREEVEVLDFRLMHFANGIGILSMAIEARDLPASRALWVNEMMRKIYPSSARQIREGRTPSLVQLRVDGQVVAEENFASPGIRNYLPPLSKIITSLLYFADYDGQEYEAVLDERMIVYTYVAIDPRSVTPDYQNSEAYRIFVSRVLYVDQWGDQYRYNPVFLEDTLSKHLYTRWAHQGTYYGFTTYSNITVAFGQFDCDDHQLSEGFLIHRMFMSRYYLMAVIALFYRATMLDFAEHTALVSRRLYQDFQDGKLDPDNIHLADTLRYEFVTFSNYWHFDELANKDEEAEHFDLQCESYRIWSMKEEIAEEVERLNTVLNEYYQKRSTQAVNRLAMLSMILGGGAVLTGFFGMNFGREFAHWIFNPPDHAAGAHWFAIALVAVVTFGALSFGAFLISANWPDYRDTLLPRTGRQDHPDRSRLSVKRVE